MLLTYANIKALKAAEFGYLQCNIELASHKLSGFNVCKYEDGCGIACIVHAGHGFFANVLNARIERTELFFSDRAAFFNILIGEIYAAQVKAAEDDKKLCIRPNAFSDLPFFRIKHNGRTLFETFPDVQFFDYTKAPIDKIPTPGSISNYHVTKSAGASTTDAEIDAAISAGFNVAIPFEGPTLPTLYNDHPVLNGDTHDLRFKDPAGFVVGLLEKGNNQFKNAGRESGFIRKAG